MIQVYLCDSDLPALKKYQKQIEEICFDSPKDYLVRVETFITAEQLLFSLSENINIPDIIVLNTALGSTNGLELARKLRERQYRGELIFLSSQPQYVFESFDVKPFYYILKKGLSKQKFNEIIGNALEYVSKKEIHFFFCEKKGIRLQIPVQSITHFTSNGRITTIHYENQSFDFYSRIDDVLDQLDHKEFFRCHRSFIVSLRYITSIKQRTIYMKNGYTIPVSQPCLSPLKAALSQFLIPNMSSKVSS